MPLSEDAGAWSNDELAGAQLFHPGWLFRNRHLQTMLGNLPPVPWLIRRRAAPLRAAATELLLDCGDGVRLQSFVSVARASGTALRPMAVLLHGWEGSTESGYVMSLGALLFSRGFDVLRLNLRDHGSTHHLNRGIFHSCRLPEVVGAARAIAARFPEAPLFLAGFSLGGNFMLRVAADAGAPPSIAGRRRSRRCSIRQPRWTRSNGVRRCTDGISCDAGRSRCAASNRLGPASMISRKCCASRSCAA
jgi:predicted alpha/beta-fold hydrolase